MKRPLLLATAVLFLVGVAPWLSGCDAPPAPTQVARGPADAPGNTSPPPGGYIPQTYGQPWGGRDRVASSFYKDPETGCEYLVFRGTYEISVVARAVWDEEFQGMMHKGCRITYTPMDSPVK